MQCRQRVLLQVFAAMPVRIADVPPDASADEIVRAAFANEALPIYAHRSSGHAVQPRNATAPFRHCIQMAH